MDMNSYLAQIGYDATKPEPPDHCKWHTELLHCARRSDRKHGPDTQRGGKLYDEGCTRVRVTQKAVGW